MLVRVGPAGDDTTPVRRRHHVVYFNKASIVFSFGFLLNLALMPLKAYLTEPFPWATLAIPTIAVSVGANETFASYETNALAFYQRRYNSSLLPPTSLYTYDADQDTDVLRLVVEPVIPAAFSFARLPGSPFYSRRGRACVRAFMTGQTNWSSLAFVELGLLVGEPSSVSGVWAEATKDGTTYLYFAAQLGRGSRTWLYVKFAYRCGLTIVIIHSMWAQYYRHYFHLLSNLETMGVGDDEKSTALEIVVGDPTALILQHTLVCTLFVVDFWCSVEIAGQSFVRLGQIQDLVTFAFAALYLSRTVWFAYLLLNVTGRLLRRLRLERLIAQVDPTTVAVAVLISVGPVTYMQSLSAFFVDVYHFLFVLPLPSSKAENYKEDCIAAAFYSLVIGFIPITYGFGKPIVAHFFRATRIQALLHNVRRNSVSIAPTHSAINVANNHFGTLAYNDWKHRALFNFVLMLDPARQSKRFVGGTIYALFQTHCHFQRNAAFSFRGSDCYVLAHQNDAVVSYRLSLCECLHLGDPLIKRKVAPDEAFGDITLDEAKGTVLLSVLFSLGFLFNLVLMPLKAYMAEPFPWTQLETPEINVAVGANETFAQYEANALAFFRARYTVHTLPESATYFYDSEQDVDVLRAKVPIVAATDFTFVRIPGSMFFSNRARRIFRDYNAGLLNGSSTAFVELGTVFGAPSSLSGVWVEPNSDGFVYFAAMLSRGTVAWLYCKLAFRCALTSYIIYELYHNYYRHYILLYANLRRFGTGDGTGQLEILVGDPTCLILQNTLVCALFVLDFWCSLEVVGQCFVRVDQSADGIKFALSTLYLARTVWFAYLTLNLMGHILRWCQGEHRFAQVDPTSVAIAVAIVVGPLTFVQLRLEVFVTIYHALFTVVLPADRMDDYKEDALPVVFYSCLVGLLPIGFGLGFPVLRRGCRRLFQILRFCNIAVALDQPFRRSSVRPSRLLGLKGTLKGGDFGLLSYNDWKHRVLFWVALGWCHQARRMEKVFKGGSIYMLFKTHHNLQRNAAFSFRGSDCYVLAHNPHNIVSYRLSLCDALHLKHQNSVIYRLRPMAAFGQIVLNVDNKVAIHFGAGKSHWIL
ncbi:hypothetical protein ACHHYP_02486 [Achlya hypogyna]|uniref:Transmembrane protein n=1 Tax=Achlya hypogyna TaxID=1202772 RepID=A0A1V9Z666_ACHHY|nr:hypothetical protein ACHHYP_02486 [Achlya hypogyna]